MAANTVLLPSQPTTEATTVHSFPSIGLVKQATVPFLALTENVFPREEFVRVVFEDFQIVEEDVDEGEVGRVESPVWSENKNEWELGVRNRLSHSQRDKGKRVRYRLSRRLFLIISGALLSSGRDQPKKARLPRRGAKIFDKRPDPLVNPLSQV